jgi:hypothetical protein
MVLMGFPLLFEVTGIAIMIVAVKLETPKFLLFDLKKSEAK